MYGVCTSRGCPPSSTHKRLACWTTLGKGYQWATSTMVKGALSDRCSNLVRCLQAFVRAVVQHCGAAGLALGSQWRTPHRNSGDWTRFRNQVECCVVQKVARES